MFQYSNNLLGIFVAMTACLVGCSFDDGSDHRCESSTDCRAGQTCYRGFCVQAEADSAEEQEHAPTGTSSQASTRADAGEAAAPEGGGSSAAGSEARVPDAGRGPQAGMQAPADEPSASSPDKNSPPLCSAPMASETCNDMDDDCDGKVDENADAPCYPDGQAGCTKQSDGTWSCEGTCASGMRACANGKLGECSGYKLPGKETCTEVGMVGADENCNGMTDEGCACGTGETRSCYGDSRTLNIGKCKAGTSTCDNGMFGPCMGAVTPGVETCGNANADDDCDGTVDNIRDLGAACVVATNAGICRNGTMQCDGKSELHCVGVAPQAETCNGMDDDCNGTTDDGFDLQNDPKNCGSCGTSCSSGDACCGGKCVNTHGSDAQNCGGCGMACAADGGCCAGTCASFSDENNCGSCGNKCGGNKSCVSGQCVPKQPTGCKPACGANETCTDGKCVPVTPPPGDCQPACTGGQTCCAGTCVDPKTDLMNCGQCGRACSGGMQPSCCNGSCVDLVSNGNCGQCGHDCSLLGSGGITCSCTKSSDGKVACTGPVLNLCL